MTPDPSILRVDDTFYIAASTFHWQPAIQLYESHNLEQWELVDYALKNNEVDLRGTQTPAGVWAPHLSYDTSTQEFWLLYSHMVNMAGREFNSNTYGIHSKSIHGPWSDPIYFTSIGFDPCLYHDEDGRHYLSILEWETRTGYQAPGHIVIAEIDLETGKLISEWVRVSKGFTTRGCVEAPQIYKRKEYYYMLLASGGTGYAHGVEIGRSKNIYGPYEPHPSREPIVTSSPNHLFSLGDPDAGHFEMYNPNSIMQKAGHGSLVETKSGEWYLAHLMSRPLPNTTLNPLGRECSLQKMQWTDDEWLEMEDGSNLAKMEVRGIESLYSKEEITGDLNEDFMNKTFSKRFMTPYHNQSDKWVNTKERSGYLRIYGNNSLFSQYEPAILATKATSFDYEVETKLLYNPEHYSQKAGLGLYYDANNWIFANISFSEEKKVRFLSIEQAKLGEKTDYCHHQIFLDNCEEIELKIKYTYGSIDILYKVNDCWVVLEENLNVAYLSDEGVNGMPGEIGGFTGLFNFIGAVDSYQHQSYADFSRYIVNNF